MNNDDTQAKISISDIGSIARIIDTELTISERMKIKKSTLFRIAGAVFVYLTIMSLFSVFL